MAVIGRKLRLMYADLIAEGVPERFVEILRRLVEPSNEGSKNDPAYHLTMTKGEPMMPAPPRKRRLSAEQRRALAMLADARRNGVTAAIMLANGPLKSPNLGQPLLERPSWRGAQRVASKHGGNESAKDAAFLFYSLIGLRIDEFLRPGRVYVGLCDDVSSGIDIGRHMLAP
jgi:Anti-sigma factor NepR